MNKIVPEGLSPDLHSELNSADVSLGRLDELRTTFADDPLALNWIERYDPTSTDTDLFNQLIDAYKARDDNLAEQISTQLAEQRTVK